MCWRSTAGIWRSSYNDAIASISNSAPGRAKRRDTNGGARRRRGHVEILIAYFAERADVRRNVDEVVVDLDDVLEARADRRERILQILERLHGLATEVGRHLPCRIDAELPRDVDHAAGARDLDHMRVSGRLGNRRRIDEARRHEVPPELASEFASHLARYVCIAANTRRQFDASRCLRADPGSS